MKSGRYRLVAERRWQRIALQIGLIATILAAAALGYWLGTRLAGLDQDYLVSLERLDDAQEARIAQLNRDLIDLRLAQSVDQQAAQSLRGLVSELRSEVADLEEEVVFYRSLMAPSSLARGLQIADFELLSAGEDDRFAFQLLLTQAEARRDWVQGKVTLSLSGTMTTSAGEEQQVLPFADLDADAVYPLPFKFRYFQNLSGRIRLPEGFRPDAVQVAATPQGGGDALERSFPWRPSAG